MIGIAGAALCGVALALPMIGHAATLGCPGVRGLSRPAVSRGRPLQTLGRAIRRRIGRVPDAEADARLGRAVVVSLGLAAISVWLGAVAALLSIIRPIMARRADLKRRADQVFNEVPELIDLYAVALQSGHNVATATREVADRGQGIIVTALRTCLAQARRGQPLSDAFEELPVLVGPPVRPLVGALIASDRDGVSITDSLAILAADVREQRRRRAETAARRLPITMLFPLVICILPAFMLLTVVPVLVNALTSLN